MTEYLGVVERNFFYWCVGDKVPDEENYKKLLEVKEGLEIKERLESIDKDMESFGDRKAYLDKMR